MIPIVTPAEMAAIDAAAPEPVDELIERAGAAVSRHALDMLGGAYGRRVVVVCGKGNNGADGRSAAIRLRRRGVKVVEIDAVAAPPQLPRCDLVIDAAYGTGLQRDYVSPRPSNPTPVLAVDIASGVDGLTGARRGDPLPATRTVTFAALKPGHLLEPGRSLCGDVRLVDIGLDVSSACAHVVDERDVWGWVRPRAADAHKWRSAVWVIAGSPGMTGAAHLASAAAMRAGAGYVRLSSPGGGGDPGAPIEVVRVPVGADVDVDVAEACRRFGALVVGPGLGRAPGVVAGVRRLLSDPKLVVPVLVDGDGLHALGDSAADLLRRPAPTVLTPHEAEFTVLGGAGPHADRLAAVRDLASRLRCVVLLKGPSTLIADPEGRVLVSTTGDQRLATAGTGDVLSGVIGAFLARGVPAFEAAAAGAFVHGRAAGLGPAQGLIASDLVDLLPTVLLGLEEV